MKKYRYLLASIALATIFIVFTIIVKTVDVRYISINNTYLGLYTLNSDFGNFVLNLGKYESMAKISDILLYLSFAYVLVMAALGVIQWVKRKSLLKVDKSLFVLLGSYIVVVIVYFLFEVMKINFAPIGEELKASYPSSHVFIGCTFFLVNTYVVLKMLKPEKKWIEYLLYASTGVICLLITFTRVLALKHWLSDIIASVLLVGVIYLLFIHSYKEIVKEEKE